MMEKKVVTQEVVEDELEVGGSRDRKWRRGGPGANCSSGGRGSNTVLAGEVMPAEPLLAIPHHAGRSIWLPLKALEVLHLVLEPVNKQAIPYQD